MPLLSGNEIHRMVKEEKRLSKEFLFQLQKPRLAIAPFDEEQLNPNSYNLRLGSKLLRYTDLQLDMKVRPTVTEIEIPEEGFVLDPQTLYLGSTVEYTETHGLVPRVDGRSSVGRLGIWVHVTAGMGDVGFCGTWTLEITSVQPVRIYAGVEICQISYTTISEDHVPYDSDKYQFQTGPRPSELWRDFT